jgi:hypothetical protein
VNYEEANSDDHSWRCRYARHSYRFIRETDKQRGLRLRRLSRLMLRIADIALIVVKTAKPPDHCGLVALRPAKFLLEIPRPTPIAIKKLLRWENSTTASLLCRCYGRHFESLSYQVQHRLIETFYLDCDDRNL